MADERATSENHSASRPRERTFRPTNYGGESGYFDSAGDTHFYDLMAGPASELDEAPAREDKDRLVATAAWAVPPDRLPRAKAWLDTLRKLPNAWLTPWREGEPSIPADVWLQEREAGTGGYLVASLQNPYFPGGSLRASLNRAADRFEDLRRAIEREMPDGVGAVLPRATRDWLESLDGADDDE